MSEPLPALLHRAMPDQLDADPVTGRYQILRAALAVAPDVVAAIEAAGLMWDFVQSGAPVPVLRLAPAAAIPDQASPREPIVRRHFSADEDAQILALKAQGKTTWTIGKMVGRSFGTVQKRLAYLDSVGSTPAPAAPEPVAAEPDPPEPERAAPERAAPEPQPEPLPTEMLSIADQVLAALRQKAGPDGWTRRLSLDAIAFALGYDDAAGIRNILLELLGAGLIEIDGGNGKGKPITAARIAKAPRPTGSADRPCMSCSKPFRSTGPGHRLCDVCRNKG